MNIVTIMNYEDDARYNRMCKIFIFQLIKHNPTCNLFIMHQKTIPTEVSDVIKQFDNIKTLKLSHDTECWYKHHNVNFKLYNLSRLDEPFIFIDADIFCFSSLDSLWNIKNDQPFIGVNHQNIPGHTSSGFKFLNSGVQVVGDPDWYKYSKFRDAFNKCEGKLMCKGFDQAHIYTRCVQDNYNYTHPDMMYEWNSCAKYGNIINRDDHWRCTYEPPEEDTEPGGYDVKLNHYWWDFKPWNLNCPVWDFYE